MGDAWSILVVNVAVSATLNLVCAVRTAAAYVRILVSVALIVANVKTMSARIVAA